MPLHILRLFYEAANYMVAALRSYTPMFSEHSACKCTVFVGMGERGWSYNAFAYFAIVRF